MSPNINTRRVYVGKLEYIITEGILAKLMDSDNSRDKSERLETSFSQDSSSVAVSSTKRAAVLVCLFEGTDGDLRVFLAKRYSTLSSHSGEVSLPGGKREETDADDVETALREAKGEIGLESSLVIVVTVLEPFVTKSIKINLKLPVLVKNRRVTIPDDKEWELFQDL